ncbi:MAG TPA: DUF1707 and FHA domain-containing protein [Streptosporangiaceae bacterium]|jgi:hypothetical protein|nr:DUF1707 and FHA domain-containing protein [Streptosporangiaceae bacterium]
MRAFGGRAADHPAAVRVCDADRDRVIAELRERFADGFLNQESLVLRVDAALRARWLSELDQVVADLPGPRPSLAEVVRGRLADARRALRRGLAAPRPAVWGGFRPPAAPQVLVLPSSTQDSLTIGRDVTCDLVLLDMTVSRSHADLRRASDGWLLNDSGSTNGTRLNGWRVTEPVPLRAGDEVSFGALTLVVIDHARHAGAVITP